MLLPLILYDIVLFIMATILYGCSFMVTILLAADFYHQLPLWLFFFTIPALVIVFVLTLIFGVFVLRLSTPSMKEGYYNSPGSGGFYIWTFYLALNRMIFLHPIKNIILYSATLRFFALRALGAKVAYASSISADVDLVDLPMVSIGKDSLVGAYTIITGHFINKEKIRLGKVVIGDNVNIGGYCHISPDVEIGDGSWIGTECRIAPMVYIGKNCIIEPMSVIPPGTRIEDGQTYPSYPSSKTEHPLYG